MGWRRRRYGSPATKQDKTPAFLGSFGVLGLGRHEMLTEDNKDHPLDASNSIHKEAILSRRSNAETHGGTSALWLGNCIG
jgi:hypothetical protein